MTKAIKLIIGTVTTVMILGIAVGALGWATNGFNDWSFGRLKNIGKQEVSTVFDDNGNALDDGKIHELPSNLNFANTPDQEGNVTLRATVKPDNAYNKALTWELSWENAASAWASGKDVNDYITLTVDSSNDTVAKISCKNPFGERGRITVKAVDNPSAKAVCNIDYVKRTTKTIVKFTPYRGGGEYVAPTDETVIPEVDFSKEGLQVQKFITMDSDFDGVTDPCALDMGTNYEFYDYGLIPSASHLSTGVGYSMRPTFSYESNTVFTKEDVCTTTVKMYLAGTSEDMKTETIDSVFEFIMKKGSVNEMQRLAHYLIPNSITNPETGEVLPIQTGAKAFDITNGYNFDDRFFIDNFSMLYKGFNVFHSYFEQEESYNEFWRTAFVENGQNKAFPFFTIAVTTTGKYCTEPITDYYSMGIELFKVNVVPSNVTVTPNGDIEF